MRRRCGRMLRTNHMLTLSVWPCVVELTAHTHANLFVVVPPGLRARLCVCLCWLWRGYQNSNKVANVKGNDVWTRTLRYVCMQCMCRCGHRTDAKVKYDGRRNEKEQEGTYRGGYGGYAQNKTIFGCERRNMFEQSENDTIARSLVRNASVDRFFFHFHQKDRNYWIADK